jgi:hypothetical protein
MKRPALFALFLVVVLLSCTKVANAQASPGGGQSFNVDCTTATPGSGIFPSINAFLQAIGPFNSVVLVKGICHENVTISNGDNFQIRFDPNSVSTNAGITGHVYIVDSPDGVYFYGLTITNPNGDGIDVSKSKVILDSCRVSNNAGHGVSISSSSDVEVRSGSFDGNSATGFNVFGHSLLEFGAGPVEIKGNTQSGIRAAQADISAGGSTVISDSGSGPGVELLGGARAQFGNWAGPNIIENNLNGGISVRENSELSIWACCPQPASMVRKNGKFGIAAGFHSQVTLSGAEVSDNTGPGVDVYATSQFDFFPGSKNQILKNGFPPNPTIPVDPNNAGLRVDGNSQAWLRNGDIFGNAGPGILVLTNSSVDFESMNFGSPIGLDPQNTGGIINCDHTSAMTSDLQGHGMAQGVSCPTTGHAPVPR